MASAFLFAVPAGAFTGFSPVPNGCVMSGVSISCPSATYTTRSNTATLQWAPNNGGYNGACATEACVSNVAFAGSSPIPATNAFIQRNIANCASTTSVTIAWVDSTTIQASAAIPTPGGVCNGAPLQIPQPLGPGPQTTIDAPNNGDVLPIGFLTALPVQAHNNYVAASNTGAVVTFDWLLFKDGTLIARKVQQPVNGILAGGFFANVTQLPAVPAAAGLYFLQAKSCVGGVCGPFAITLFNVLAATPVVPTVDPTEAIKQCLDVNLLDIFNPFPGQQLHALGCSFNTVVGVMSGVPPFLWIKQISDVVSATTTPMVIDGTMHWPNGQAFTLYSSATSSAGVTGIINNFARIGGLTVRQWIETFLWLGFIGYAISIPYRLLSQ